LPSIEAPRRVSAAPVATYCSGSGDEERHHTRLRKETLMSAQSGYLQVDAVGVFPSYFLLFVLILAVLGVVAHAAFV